MRAFVSALCAAGVAVATAVVLTGAPGPAGAATAAAPPQGVAEPVSIDGATGRNMPVETLSRPMVRISSDGRYVAFCSAHGLDPEHPEADGHTACYRRDRQEGRTELVSYALDGTVPSGSAGVITMTPDGRYLGYVLGSWLEILRYDTVTHQVTELASATAAAYSLTPSGDYVADEAVSSDGRYALSATKPVRIDLQTGAQVDYATSADGVAASDTDVSANGAAISGDGRYVAFWSTDYSLVPGTTSPCSSSCGRLFRKDLVTGAVTLVDVASDGTPGSGVGGPDDAVSISDDGSKVSFGSIETLDDADVRHEVGRFYGYVRDLDAGQTHLVAGSEYAAADPVGTVRLSGDGTTVAWITDVGDFVSRSDNDAARHQMTALAADPPTQSAIVGLDAGTRVTLRATYDDGTTQPVPIFAWRVTVAKFTSAGATVEGDHFRFWDVGPQTVGFTVTVNDEDSRSVAFTIDFVLPPVTITADDRSITYGDAEPAYTYTTAGLAAGDSLAQPPTCSVAGPHVEAGTYPITCQGARVSGYSISYAPGTLTVTRAPTSLTVRRLSGTTVSASLTYGSGNAPAVDQPIAFRAGKTALCTARTDAAGKASCTLTAQQWLTVLLALGHYQADFAGSTDLLPSTASG